MKKKVADRLRIFVAAKYDTVMYQNGLAAKNKQIWWFVAQFHLKLKRKKPA